jgi:hypothetical protein
MMTKIRAIVTVATGMVGEGVLHECLHHADVEKVLVVGRKHSGTDSSRRGKSMARVKGKTENELLKLPFKWAYMFRPGYMKPTTGLKNTLGFYFGSPIVYPVLKFVLPGFTCTLEEVGRAMINAAIYDYTKNILEVRDIVVLAKKIG